MMDGKRLFVMASAFAVFFTAGISVWAFIIGEMAVGFGMILCVCANLINTYIAYKHWKGGYWW